MSFQSIKNLHYNVLLLTIPWNISLNITIISNFIGWIENIENVH